MDVEVFDFAKIILKEAEKQFGSKVEGWDFVAIEVEEDGPYIKYYPWLGEITIALSQKILDDPIQLIFQLSHEVCHLLHPSRTIDGDQYETLCINEGLSTYFQINFTGNYYDKEVLEQNLKEHGYNYYSAYLDINSLQELNSNAIRLLRATQPQVDLLTIADFKNLSFEVDDDLITRLLKRWNYA